ncbi:hypothetical protein SDC9_162507 [bioreactor metagenome]|uniref:Uncharacterized protein n=1 Tax=bioreactor metagenome TaxID=1076179 RepID=A0A645FL89_9ZZZZ
MADEAGGQHPGVVEHQTVPRTQQGGQIVKMEVTCLSRPAVQSQQAGGVPPVQRGLGDQLRRQVEGKIRGVNKYQSL